MIANDTEIQRVHEIYELETIFIESSPFLVVAESPCALLDIVDGQQEPTTVLHSEFNVHANHNRNHYGN